jgi:hypothetical protein
VLCKPKVAEVIASVTMFDNAIREKKFTVIEQAPLDEAACNARKRPIGNYGGWGWGGIGDVDATPLEAVTLAYHAVMTSKRKPGRKQRVIF